MVTLPGGERVKVKVANLVSCCISPSGSCWEDKKRGVKWFIYQADVSGAAAVTACCVPLIWCLTRSQSSQTNICYFSLSPINIYIYISIESIKWQREKGESPSQKWQIKSATAKCCVLQKWKESARGWEADLHTEEHNSRMIGHIKF